MQVPASKIEAMVAELAQLHRRIQAALEELERAAASNEARHGRVPHYVLKLQDILNGRETF